MAGILTGDDMARWRAPVETPLTLRLSAATPSANAGPGRKGRCLLEALALAARASTSTAMDPTGPDFVHTVVKCLKLAFADREAWYGDPDFVDVPVADLLSADYANARRALVGARASFELRPGAPGGRTPGSMTVRPGPGAAAGAGEPTPAAARHRRAHRR